MSASEIRDGLSARQKTSHNAKYSGSLLTPSWVFLAALSLIISSCHERTAGQDGTPKKDTVADISPKPKVNIKVNKHFDDDGNVIGFDSTYTSYYSNIEGDTSRMDSLIKTFDTFYNRNHFKLFGDEFNSLFFNDSLRYPDFFHDDFFLKRYELNDSYFRDMMNRMDSIKNRFYKDQSRRSESRDL